MCLRPQRGAFSGYTRQTVASKNRCFTVRRVLCRSYWQAQYLRFASRSMTEGERGRFLCKNLGRRSISKGNMATPQLKGAVFQKETWPPHSLKPTTAEAVRWPRLFVKYLPRAKLWGGHVCLSKTAPLRCVVAMLASELLRLPACKLSRLSCEVAIFVCQVPQVSGFKLWGGHVCLQYLPQVEMCGCLLLKCCACQGFKLWCGHVCFWNIVPATALLAAKALRLPWA